MEDRTLYKLESSLVLAGVIITGFQEVYGEKVPIIGLWSHSLEDRPLYQVRLLLLLLLRSFIFSYLHHPTFTGMITSKSLHLWLKEGKRESIPLLAGTCYHSAAQLPTKYALTIVNKKRTLIEPWAFDLCITSKLEFNVLANLGLARTFKSILGLREPTFSIYS